MSERDWWKPFRDYEGNVRTFMVWNTVAGVFHFANAIATLVVDVDPDDLEYPIYQVYSDWMNKTKFCLNNGPGDYTTVFELTGTDTLSSVAGVNVALVIDPLGKDKRYSLSLFYLIFFFHLLSALFQLTVGCFFGRSYSKSVIDKGVNVWRFLEYSISASLMLLSLALIQYIQDVYTHIGLGVLTAATMLFGLAAELLFSDEFLSENKLEDKPITADLDNTPNLRGLQLVGRASFVNEMGVRKRSLWSNGLGDDVVKRFSVQSAKEEDVHVKIRRIGWCVHFSGWLTMLAAYLGILMNHFYWSSEKSVRDAPDFVEPLLWVILLLYNIFGFTQLFQMCAKDPMLSSCWGRKSQNRGFLCVNRSYQGTVTDDGKEITCTCCCTDLTLNEGIELFYVLNSLVTKSVLGWVVISQLIIRENLDINQSVKCE